MNAYHCEKIRLARSFRPDFSTLDDPDNSLIPYAALNIPSSQPNNEESPLYYSDFTPNIKIRAYNPPNINYFYHSSDQKFTNTNLRSPNSCRQDFVFKRNFRFPMVEPDKKASHPLKSCLKKSSKIPIPKAQPNHKKATNQFNSNYEKNYQKFLRIPIVREPLTPKTTNYNISKYQHVNVKAEWNKYIKKTANPNVTAFFTDNVIPLRRRVPVQEPKQFCGFFPSHEYQEKGRKEFQAKKDAAEELNLQLERFAASQLQKRIANMEKISKEFDLNVKANVVVTIGSILETVEYGWNASTSFVANFISHGTPQTTLVEDVQFALFNTVDDYFCYRQVKSEKRQG